MLLEPFECSHLPSGTPGPKEKTPDASLRPKKVADSLSCPGKYREELLNVDPPVLSAYISAFSVEQLAEHDFSASTRYHGL